MARCFFADDAVGLFRQVFYHLERFGDQVSPRGQLTHEERNVTLILEDPTRNLMVGVGRKLNTKLAAIEALQLVAGISDARLTVKAAPNTAAFMHDGIFRGAYGPRSFAQVRKALERLQRDPDTRQAVATIWHPVHELTDDVDMPCTVYLSWVIRNGELEMTTHMRSNDLWWGYTYDVFMFTTLQRTMASFLGVAAGRYVHVVDSMHYYHRDSVAIDRFMVAADQAWPYTTPPFDAGNLWAPTPAADWLEIAQHARDIIYTPTGDDWFSQQMRKVHAS